MPASLPAGPAAAAVAPSALAVVLQRKADGSAPAGVAHELLQLLAREDVRDALLQQWPGGVCVVHLGGSPPGGSVEADAGGGAAPAAAGAALTVASLGPASAPAPATIAVTAATAAAPTAPAPSGAPAGRPSLASGVEQLWCGGVGEPELKRFSGLVMAGLSRSDVIRLDDLARTLGFTLVVSCSVAGLTLQLFLARSGELALRPRCDSQDWSGSGLGLGLDECELQEACAMRVKRFRRDGSVELQRTAGAAVGFRQGQRVILSGVEGKGAETLNSRVFTVADVLADRFELRLAPSDAAFARAAPGSGMVELERSAPAPATPAAPFGAFATSVVLPHSDPKRASCVPDTGADQPSLRALHIALQALAAFHLRRGGAAPSYGNAADARELAELAQAFSAEQRAALLKARAQGGGGDDDDGGGGGGGRSSSSTATTSTGRQGKPSPSTEGGQPCSGGAMEVDGAVELVAPVVSHLAACAAWQHPALARGLAQIVLLGIAPARGDGPLSADGQQVLFEAIDALAGRTPPPEHVVMHDRDLEELVETKLDHLMRAFGQAPV